MPFGKVANLGVQFPSFFSNMASMRVVFILYIVTAGIAYIDNLAPGPRFRLMRDVDFRNDARNCEQLTKEFIFERLA